MINVILFGPPGVGKSTLIGILKTKGISAIDLEDVYPNKIRFQLPNLVQGTVLGAADLNPKRHYPRALKVLLIANQSAYDARRAHRDREQPGKSQQAQHNVEDWKRNSDQLFDLVLDTTHRSAHDTACELIKFLKERSNDEK